MRGFCLAICSVWLLSGCASIFSGTTEKLTFNSVPDGATIAVANRAGASVHSGPAPATVVLKRGSAYFKSEAYMVTVSMPGYKTQTINITGSMNGWYWGNLVLGGLIGMVIVDPLTGAMYNLRPNEVQATLVQETASTANGDGVLTIMLAQDVPADLWQYAQPIGVQ